MSEFENPWGKNTAKKRFEIKNQQDPIFLGLIGLFVFISIWFLSGICRIKEGEVGVIMRFGEVSRTVSPGLNYHFPYPIEKIIIKKVSVYNKIDGGENEEHGLILTGDENMISVNYIVLWKIKDVIEFLFTSRNPEQTITVAAESSIREIIGQTVARLALTEGRETIGIKAQELLQKLLDSYKMGVQIVSIQLQKVEAPVDVIQAFNDLQASLTDADRLKNEAQAYEMDILPKARGESEKIIQHAKGYAKQIVANAEGESERFQYILNSYKTNPTITCQKLYNETIDIMLEKANKTIIDGKVSSNFLPYMNIQK